MIVANWNREVSFHAASDAKPFHFATKSIGKGCEQEEEGRRCRSCVPLLPIPQKYEIIWEPLLVEHARGVEPTVPLLDDRTVRE